MKPQFWAALLTLALIGYFVLMAGQAVAFIAAGEPISVLLGLAILVLPLLGIWVVVREWQFGLAVQRLAQHLAERDELPADDLPKRPSGRAERAAADERFQQRAVEVEAAPDDPGAWFRLAVAYDNAGDRKRARKSMRTAVQLYGQHSR